MEQRALENMANAVVKLAANDYRKALITLKKAQDEVDELARFFEGDTIKMYTSLDGTMLKEQLEEQVKRCHYSMTEIRKEIGTQEEEES